jgi:hypothetical protein
VARRLIRPTFGTFIRRGEVAPAGVSLPVNIREGQGKSHAEEMETEFAADAVV